MFVSFSYTQTTCQGRRDSLSPWSQWRSMYIRNLFHVSLALFTISLLFNIVFLINNIIQLHLGDYLTKLLFTELEMNNNIVLI